jgi:hypothetical protein
MVDILNTCAVTIYDGLLVSTTNVADVEKICGHLHVDASNVRKLKHDISRIVTNVQHTIQIHLIAFRWK